MSHANSFRDLMAYKNVRAISCDIFKKMKIFPEKYRYALTD